MQSTLRVLGVAGLSLAVLVAPSEAWGADGHKITASVAQALLSPEEVAWVKNALGGEDLVGVATWADTVCHTPAYAWSQSLHFLNVVDTSCKFDWDRDCHDNDGVSGRCVPGTILNYTQRMLVAPARVVGAAAPTAKPDAPLSVRDEALRFITHFMGDIHQPLHVAHTTDRGGNIVPVEEGFDDDRKLNLHAVWDKGMIQKVEKEHNYTFAGFAAHLTKQVHGPWAEKAKSWARCLTGEKPDLKACVTEIAQESLSLACDKAYPDGHGANVTKNEELDEHYFDSREPLVEKRLAAGGVRLAALVRYLKRNAKRAAIPTTILV